MIGAAAVGRLLGEVRAALRRRPTHEARLAGVLRALAPYEPRLLRELGDALEVLVRRGSFERPLYAVAVRTLSECGDERLTMPLGRVLGQDEAGGLASLSAACHARAGALAEPLSRAANSRHPVTAFAAEVARLARGEARGARLAALAPKIKEAHRIALCTELFAGLLTASPLPVEVSQALGVLRDAERHLGRWLLMAELAARAGDPAPLAEARLRAEEGVASARGAWAFVAWALDGSSRPPALRPSLELMARLSDRPSTERDSAFLFRLARAGAPQARSTLQSLIRGHKLSDVTAIRAALHLCRDYGEQSLVPLLRGAASRPRRDALRGLAAAALYDCGERGLALDVAKQLETTRHLSALCWAGLVHVSGAGARNEALVSELCFRRVERGAYE